MVKGPSHDHLPLVLLCAIELLDFARLLTETIRIDISTPTRPGRQVHPAVKSTPDSTPQLGNRCRCCSCGINVRTARSTNLRSLDTPDLDNLELELPGDSEPVRLTLVEPRGLEAAFVGHPALRQTQFG